MDRIELKESKTKSKQQIEADLGVGAEVVKRGGGGRGEDQGLEFSRVCGRAKREREGEGREARAWRRKESRRKRERIGEEPGGRGCH